MTDCVSGRHAQLQLSSRIKIRFAACRPAEWHDDSIQRTQRWNVSGCPQLWVPKPPIATRNTVPPSSSSAHHEGAPPRLCPFPARCRVVMCVSSAVSFRRLCEEEEEGCRGEGGRRRIQREYSGRQEQVWGQGSDDGRLQAEEGPRQGLLRQGESTVSRARADGRRSRRFLRSRPSP